ncbi:MAG: DUF2007 domain-containing protein [Thiolinea sp.]
MKTIYKAGNVTEAHIVAGMLEARGIQSHVGGHHLQSGVGEIATMDFARVYVADEDYDAAIPVIAEYEQQKPEEEHEEQTTTTTMGMFTKPMMFWIAVFLLLFWFFF